jgi:hypothetical protein
LTSNSEDWEALDTFVDELSAQALAGRLRNEGVPVDIRISSPLPGLVNDVQVWVPKSLAHRARWIINTSPVSEEELAFAATGELGTDKQ